MIWVFLAFLFFLAVIVFAGIRGGRKLPREIAATAERLGMTLKCKGDFSGWNGVRSSLRIGTVYAGMYRDLTAAVFTLVDHEGGKIGAALAFRFLHPLPFSLFSTFHLESFTTTEISDAYRDIYLEKIDAGVAGMKTWSREKDKTMMLLRSGDVGAHLKSLTDLLQRIDEASLPGLPRAGFVINDQGITLCVKDAALLDRELVERAYLLCRAVSGAGFGRPVGAVATEGRALKILATAFLVLFLGFIIGMMIMGILKMNISTLLSVRGLN